MGLWAGMASRRRSWTGYHGSPESLMLLGGRLSPKDRKMTLDALGDTSFGFGDVELMP